MISLPEAADRQALILLCAGTHVANASAAPLGPVAWSNLRAALVAAGRKPGDLLGLSAQEIAQIAQLTDDQASRVAALLHRGGPMTIELERFASRGIWVSTLLDETYPSRLLDCLGDKAPPLLFGSGDISIAGHGGLAIIGSRDADEEGLEFAASVAQAAARGALTVVSGAARGIDSAAMHGALDYGGAVAGVLADSLDKRIREPQIRTWLAEGQLCLVSPYVPQSGFSVGAAMGRNKLIYALADAALVVSAADGGGGTWSGAIEALKLGCTPVLVRQIDGPTGGNRRLIERGAHAFPGQVPEILTNSRLQTIAALGVEAHDGEKAQLDDSVQDTLFGAPEPARPKAPKKPRRRSAPSAELSPPDST